MSRTRQNDAARRPRSLRPTLPTADEIEAYAAYRSHEDEVDAWIEDEIDRQIEA